MCEVYDYNVRVQTRFRDLLHPPTLTQRNIPRFSSFFIGLVFGVLASKLACLCQIHDFRHTRHAWLRLLSRFT